MEIRYISQPGTQTSSPNNTFVGALLSYRYTSSVGTWTCMKFAAICIVQILAICWLRSNCQSESHELVPCDGLCTSLYMKLSVCFNWSLAVRVVAVVYELSKLVRSFNACMEFIINF